MHNEQKGRLPLEDFRVKLVMDDFFKLGDMLTLKDELKYLKEKKYISTFSEDIFIIDTNDTIMIEFCNSRKSYKLYNCPITNWKYFFGIFPIDVINSDDDDEHEVGLQPRYLIKDKVFNLYRHFQLNPVLQPSIARINKNKILVFDGQHKIASLLWNGWKEFALKIYLNPEPQRLNDTNILAHDEFSQTRFYSSIMVAKLGTQFGKKFDNYKSIQDNCKKTEAGFIKYLKDSEKLTTQKVNEKFRSFLYNSVLDSVNNKVFSLVSKSNRGTTEHPLTIDMLKKSLLSNFIYIYPVEDDLASLHYKRDIEIDNVIMLFNIIFDEGLCKWDENKPESDTTQNKLNRMFRSKSIMAWSELLKDAVSAKLEIMDADEKAMLFYREWTEKDFDKIRNVIRRLFNWNIWSSPINSDIDRILSDNKSEIKRFLKDKGLTAGYLMGAPE
jgi:hypothetical protein